MGTSARRIKTIWGCLFRRPKNTVEQWTAPWLVLLTISCRLKPTNPWKQKCSNMSHSNPCLSGQPALTKESESNWDQADWKSQISIVSNWTSKSLFKQILCQGCIILDPHEKNTILHATRGNLFAFVGWSLRNWTRRPLYSAAERLFSWYIQLCILELSCPCKV